MRAVIQRVTQAQVEVNEQSIARIGHGLLVLLGAGHGDSEEQVEYLAGKIAHLRIFEDEDGKTNLSVLDVGGEALVVSQFTLYADTRKGRRPSFTGAALPDTAGPLVDLFAEKLSALGVPVQKGEFGAFMQVRLVNDGPMTIIMERE